MSYQKQINNIADISFDKIRKVSVDHIQTLPEHTRNQLWDELNRGTAILDSEDQLCQYLFSYGLMHQAKMHKAFQALTFDKLSKNEYEIIDWGCGQGLATVCLFDKLRNLKKEGRLKRVTLIEPSSNALDRAEIHISAYVNDDVEICLINKYLDEIDEQEIKSSTPITVHLFSNILDVDKFDLHALSNKIGHKLEGCHYFFCVSPLIPNNPRLDTFYEYFGTPETFANKKESEYYYRESGRPCSYNLKVFKLEDNNVNLLYVDYLPTKQSYAAYQLDGVNNAFQTLTQENRDRVKKLYMQLSSFEVAAPFDVKASVFEDTHPILAVLNNIITRGLPTKASPLIEDAFNVLGNKKLDDSLGSIKYTIDDIDATELFLALHCVDSRFDLDNNNYNKKALDSDLEERYIIENPSKILKQILLPQRSLKSITGKESHHSQRVDFACQYPYETSTNIRGLVIEIDGSHYHSSEKAIRNDSNRISDLENSKWICKRIGESNLNDKLGIMDDYLHNLAVAYKKEFSDDWIRTLQFVLSPIAIARVQKTVIDALLTGHLSIEHQRWQILVTEHDVPCAALAFADLIQMFEKLTFLSNEYCDLKFPDIDLKIISSDEFKSSPLHASYHPKVNIEIIDNITPIITATNFDLIIDTSVLRRSEIERLDYTNFKCKNKAYFNIRSSHFVCGVRQIYTTDTIVYKPMVFKDEQGLYINIEENCAALTYFVQLLFRKEEFRSGQLPILSRALQNQCVIGLLPTGGGKSLTYQLAAMLQPGVTIVVDPLRSLMQDQFDGLINIGIDTCTFINSTIDSNEKERRAKIMENSQVQFVFLSPERLGIYSFREKLRNMQDLGVYFSYGVIDEVHCVSEWGHDFRFTYLHLGHNLYKYVLPKDGGNSKSITLFGLTATASFDVLADVERELSGDGMFDLDSDTIVRDENTNRFELQYRIERVPIVCKEDKFFDPLNKIDRSLPRAVMMTDKWSVYESKRNYIKDYISDLPELINELQGVENLNNIADKFYERQSIAADSPPHLCVEMPLDFTSKKDIYNQAGIVFCPHSQTTSISVVENATSLNKNIVDVGLFVGSSEGIGDGVSKIQKLASSMLRFFCKNHNSKNEYIQQLYNKGKYSGVIDAISFEYLDRFRDDKSPLMVATKAFGMGIDKPNVRFTINMNYSSSLESFVQEAGRAGRNRKMALSTILISDYKLYRVNKKCPNNQYTHNNKEILKSIKNKWFKEGDLEKILAFYNIHVDDSYIDICTPETDMAKLRCEVCYKRFAFNLCAKQCTKCKKGPCVNICSEYYTCQLKNVPQEIKSQYMYIADLYESLNQNHITISRRNFEFQNIDYETVMYFYTNNFKGKMIEERTMNELLCKSNTEIFLGNDAEIKTTTQVSDFLERLLNANVGDTLVALISTNIIYSCKFDGVKHFVTVLRRNGEFVSVRDIKSGEIAEVDGKDLVIERDTSDISKAIYRMCCIGLIDDFTQDYGKKYYRVVTQRKEDGGYYKALQRFLERYFSKERAAIEIQKVPTYEGDNEIQKCLGYLTEFIYEKIAAKRKQAIDDMRTFCMIGIDESKNWLDRNEDLKDYIYYYFNSKFARVGFTINSEPFSLTDDTDGGKNFSYDTLFKFLRVINDDVFEMNSPKDNIKHLQGAVRLIRRSVTDRSNPTLDWLNVFCLLYLKVGNNINLQEELKKSFIDGYIGFYENTKNKKIFYDSVNRYLSVLSDRERGGATKDELALIEQWSALCELNIQSKWLDEFKNNYLN